MKKPNLKLKATIIEKGISLGAFAEIIEMPVNTFSKKLNGHFEFTESEISKICEMLEKKPTDIFFNNDVAVIATNKAS